MGLAGSDCHATEPAGVGVTVGTVETLSAGGEAQESAKTAARVAKQKIFILMVAAMLPLSDAKDLAIPTLDQIHITRHRFLNVPS